MDASISVSVCYGALLLLQHTELTVRVEIHCSLWSRMTQAARENRSNLLEEMCVCEAIKTVTVKTGNTVERQCLRRSSAAKKNTSALISPAGNFYFITSLLPLVGLQWVTAGPFPVRFPGRTSERRFSGWGDHRSWYWDEGTMIPYS